MPRSNAFSWILLAVGIALLVWGFNASESLASETSELFEGAPSNKAIALLVLGGIIGAAGLINLLRSRK